MSRAAASSSISTRSARAGSSHGEARIPVPAWLAAIERAWAGIPADPRRQAGRPRHPRASRPSAAPLDWEDFDLFRTAGIQAASYIAEARSQQALADAQRFDEFNRRFAFIMHDIKNLVSQLSLVARNAERHADNPEFRADMIATLQSSVRKMNDLLARLSPGAAREAEPPRPVEVQPAARRDRRGQAPRPPGQGERRGRAWSPGPIRPASSRRSAISSRTRSRRATRDEPVELRFFESGGDVAIEVIDRGHGMSAAFVRDRLFQPFVSTKESGFGIGAYEARALILAMGGRLDVESGEGEGTRFTLYLPAAEDRGRLSL